MGVNYNEEIIEEMGVGESQDEASRYASLRGKGKRNNV